MIGRALVVVVMCTALCGGQRIVYPEMDMSGRCVLRSGLAGSCLPLAQCPAVLSSLHHERPVTCGFQGRHPIVCCPVNEALMSTTPNTINPHQPQFDISAPNVDFACGNSVPTPVSPIPEDYIIEHHRLTRLMEQLRRRGFTISDVFKTGVLLKSFAWSNGTHQGRESFGIASAIGGLHARRVLAKYMVLIGERISNSRTDWFCDGVLINAQWVLSAAHCFDRRTTNVVRLGEYDHSDDFDGNVHQDVGVASVTRHPDYTFPRAYHDLALIRLTGKLTFGDFINPACLPWGSEVKRNLVGRHVALTGWGATEFGGAGSPILQEVNVTVFSSSRCDQSYSSLPQYTRFWPQGIAEETLCAGDPEGGKDACQGDSGGPVVYLDDTGCFVVAGVVSKGHGCGLQDFPGLYVDLRRPGYLTWIKRLAF